MPFTEMEESIFASFLNDSKFLSNDNQKNMIAAMFLCPYCCKIASYHKFHHSTSTCIGYMNLYCDQCLYNWVICSQCNFEMQPKSSSLRVQKRNRHDVAMSLSNMMCQHTIENHNTGINVISNKSDHQYPKTGMLIEVNENQDNEIVSFHDEFYFENSDESCALSITDESNEKMQLKSQLYRVFPDMPDNNVTIFNRHVRDILFELNCHQSYSDYLIKKTWLKGSSSIKYKISKSDTDLFLRIVRNLIMNSREEQGKIVDIYRRIEDRSEDAIQQLNQRILYLETKIEKYEATFNLIDSSYLHEIMIEPIRLNDDKIDTDGNNDNSLNCHFLPLPHTIQDARKLMETNSSFVGGLLTPPINVNPSDGYAYILPSRLLPIFVSSGLQFEHLTENTDILSLDIRSRYRSPDIYSTMIQLELEDLDPDGNSSYDDLDTEDVYHIGLGYWSDGCDVGGASKANRSLVKLVTIHVIHPTLTENHVFPVGFGNNKGDHEYVRCKILNDLYDLQRKKKLIYVPSLKKVVAVRFFLAFVIQDRVEHCDFTGFSGHSGTFSTVPGVSCPFVIFSDRCEHVHSLIIQKSVAACSNCAKYRLKTYFSGNYHESAKSNFHCIHCTDWNLLDVRFKPHKDYPTDANDYNEDKLMMAKQITFPSMIEACDVIHENIYLHKWTKEAAQRYAQIECLKTSVIEDIYQYSRSIRSAKKSEAQRPVPLLPRKLLPSGMTQSILRLDQCIVGVMHTLILNLGKHMLLTISELLSKVKIWSSFLALSNDLLNDIRKLSLSWCKCYHYGSTDKPGSMWVSENYLGFVLVSKHIFSVLPDESNVVHPIQNVVWAYNTLVCSIMCETEPDDESCDKTESLAKIFLSYFNTMDNMISIITQNQIKSNTKKGKKRKRDISKIESTSCILNVLSVVDEMRKRGIQRNYWEGGLSGEGMLRFVKPLVKRGLGQTGVYKCTLKKLYQIRAINNMINNQDQMIEDEIHSCDKEGTDEFFDKERYRKFHSYRNLLEIEGNIEEKKVLSCAFFVKEKKFFSIYQRRKKKFVIEIILSDAETKLGTCIFNAKLALLSTTKEISEISKKHKDYVSALLLPFKIITVNENVKYYILSENHYEYTKDFTWRLPSLMPIKVQNNIERTPIWNDRSKCERYIKRNVLPLEGKYNGTVTSFHYRRGVIGENSAVWIVKYVTIKKGTRSKKTYKRVEYSYNELIQVVL